MKRWMAMALCALLLLAGGAACAESAEVADELTQTALGVLSAMIEGDFGTVTEQFDENMAAAVTEDALAAGWQSVTAQLGGVTGVSAAQADTNSRSVAVQLAHERGASVMMLAFDGAGCIASMYIAPQTQAPEAPEAELPQGVTAQAVTLFAGTERELSGELLIPENAGADTAYVVLAHGSGPSDLDETIGGNKPFRDLVYGLAALGVGSLRFDKVTYAHPECPVTTVEQEYLEPVAEALRVLRETTGAARCYLAGHSEGGMLAPYLVQACGFDGGIALAGTPWQLWEISCAQNLAVIAALPEEQQGALLAQVDAERAKGEQLEQMTDEEAAQTTVFGIGGAYLVHMARMDQAQIAKDCGKPFLFLWGEADFQVSREAFDAWRERLGEDARFTYRTYPGLNHLFMPAGEDDSILNAQAAYQTPRQMDAQVAQDIAAWIAAQ